MQSRQLVLTVFALFATWYLAACVAQPLDGPPPGAARQAPGDFSLLVHIEGDRPAYEPAGYTSQYVIETNRRLRVALGPGARADYFPRKTCRLTTDQIELLYHFVIENHLPAEPSSPQAESRAGGDAPASIVYTVTLSGEGSTHRYRTTPDESPATLALVRRLIELRSPYLPVPAQPITTAEVDQP